MRSARRRSWIRQPISPPTVSRMGRYHPAIRSFRNRYEFDDIFLVDAVSGVVVYTTSKEIDFGTSLKDGPFALTNIGRAFQQAAAASWKGFYAFADFEHCISSYGGPGQFHCGADLRSRQENRRGHRASSDQSALTL